jgi:hypothetical protein
MSDHRELPFPSFDDEPVDTALAGRLSRSYASLPPAPLAQVDACVAAVLAAATPGARRRVLQPRWWWGAAAAAVLVVTVARPWRADLRQRAADSTGTSSSASPATPVGGISEDASGAVHFELALPRAAQAVSIVGDFNGWDAKATPMTRDRGEWRAKVALPPGRHVYAFVVDGSTWVIDPMAPQVPDSEYGPTNAVIVDPR